MAREFWLLTELLDILQPQGQGSNKVRYLHIFNEGDFFEFVKSEPLNVSHQLCITRSYENQDRMNFRESIIGLIRTNTEAHTQKYMLLINV